jgi:lipid-binding SYLF domain-containing protein
MLTARFPRFLFAIFLLVPLVAGAWQPDPGDQAQVKAGAELDRYRANAKVAPYIDKAYGYAILPVFWRIAAGFGINYGKGLVIEEGVLVGTTATLQGTLGFTYGLEVQSQIILFQTREAMEIFQTGRFEFQGRAGVSAIVFGASSNPAFLPEVAIFSRTKAGLMVEAAAILAKYKYKVLPQ